MSTRDGGCMCGAVRFTARGVPSSFGVCHCEMCRRWTGSALMGVTVPADGVTWTGEENIARIQSSDWAERAFCAKCGSGLFYHVTMDGPMNANLELPIGILDDANGLTLNNEIYFDHKPDSFALTGDHERLTRAETLRKFGIEE